MAAYVGQTKTPRGVIFHYAEGRKVESLYYSDDELGKLARGEKA